MFDTEGFQNINTAPNINRQQQSKGKTDQLIKKVYMGKRFQGAFRRDKS